MNSVDRMLNELLAREGGYVNDPNDAGGETNFGITSSTARRNGYTGSIRSMTKEEALAIYRNEYWHKPGFDDVAHFSVDIAAELFDTGVNMGPKVAATFLQRVLNVFNRMARDFKDISVDGDIGPATLSALSDFLSKRGDEGVHAILKALNCLQGARYIELAEKRQTNETFVYGWISNRISMSL